MAFVIRQAQEASEEQLPYLAKHAICLAKKGKHIKLAIAEVLAKAALGPQTFERVCGEVLRQGYKVEEFVVEGNLAVALPDEEISTEG